MPDSRPRRSAVWAAGALAVCCTLHALLLTGGLAGIGAGIGAATSNTALLGTAGVVLAVAIGVVIAWHRRRPRHQGCPPAPNERSHHEQQR
ncbi:MULTISPECIES: hypothetical protein [Micromonospora]|uniref:hypothetical protein n=1 Tax=Micromonospora TaxID=1873 RepID=UPI0008284249|nr:MULTISPECIES: hypothetical protein [Micromonospora]MDG4756218.1 hypothetical protein [Micromonospora sp. WMMD718]SCL43303.1 hypothetical protein GA0070615_6388 [Micromonospora aurantiaca]